MILKARAACSLPALESLEFKAAVAAWAEIFSGEVQPARLNRCYLHAMRYRNSSYPLTAGEICAAHREILLANRGQWPDDPFFDSARALPETAESICPRCHGSKWEVTAQGARRCDHSSAAVS